jgi:hypothetical protein
VPFAWGLREIMTPRDCDGKRRRGDLDRRVTKDAARLPRDERDVAAVAGDARACADALPMALAVQPVSTVIVGSSVMMLLTEGWPRLAALHRWARLNWRRGGTLGRGRVIARRRPMAWQAAKGRLPRPVSEAARTWYNTCAQSFRTGDPPPKRAICAVV